MMRDDQSSYGDWNGQCCSVCGAMDCSAGHHSAGLASDQGVIAANVERCAKVVDDLARLEDRALEHAETPNDKGRCAVIAAELRRAAKAIRAQEQQP